MSMREQDDVFENDLRGQLATLAHQSPSGPTADGVLGALHARSERRQRFGAIASLVVALVAVVVFIVQRNGSAESREGVEARADSRNGLPVSAVMKPENATVVAHAHSISPRLVPSGGDDTDSAAWHTQASALSLAPAADGKESSLTSLAHATAADWNLSLQLTLASTAMDGDGSPMIRFTSPW